MNDELRLNDIRLKRTAPNTVTLLPLTANKAARLVLLGSGEGETSQHLRSWLELNMKNEEWLETLVISAWDDYDVVGPHYEIASGCNKGAGGSKRPISFWMNEENPTKHLEVLRIDVDGSLQAYGAISGKAFKFQNGWALTETADSKGIQLVKPDGSVAQKWKT